MLGSTHIPKRLVQTGKSRKLSLLAQVSAVNLKLLNPDFEYLYFDDNDVELFIDTHFPQYRSVFNGFSANIQKYDFFRYLAVYHYGGFYFDLDVMLAKSVEELCVHSCVFPFEELSIHPFLRDVHGMDWEVGNYAFGAVAGHPLIGAIIANCIKAQLEPHWVDVMLSPIPRMFREPYSVLCTTGPGLVSRTLAEFSDRMEAVHVLFPPDVCDTRYWHQFGDYGVHLQEGGWRKKAGLLKRRLTKIWTERRRAHVLKKSRLLGPNRGLEFRLDMGR